MSPHYSKLKWETLEEQVFNDVNMTLHSAMEFSRTLLYINLLLLAKEATFRKRHPYLANIYLFKVHNKNIRKKCQYVQI